MDASSTVEMEQVLLRLSVAAFAGGVVGLNRELHGKAAGVRTHALVTLGAAIASLVASSPVTGAAAIDPNVTGRVLQGIMTGIGFLGAGVILRDAGGHVTGLTTAAAVWVCAAMGVVCGLGRWDIVVVSIALVLIVLFVGRPIEHAAERLFKRGERDRRESDVDP